MSRLGNLLQYSTKKMNFLLLSYVVVLALIFPFKPGTFVTALHIIFSLICILLLTQIRCIKYCFKDSYFRWTFAFTLLFVLNMLFYPKIGGVERYYGLRSAGIFPLLFAILFLLIKDRSINVFKLLRVFSVLILVNAIMIYIYEYQIELGERWFLIRGFTAINKKLMFSKRYAVYLALGAFWALLQVFRSREKLGYRILFALVFLGNGMFMIFTDCRGVLISFFMLTLAFGIFFVIKKIGYKKKYVFRGIALIIVLLVIAYNSSPMSHIKARLEEGAIEFLTFYNSGKFVGSWGTRLNIWVTILDHINHYKWFGIGINNLGYYYPNWFNETNGIDFPYVHRAHNIYLEYFVGMGFLGLFLIVMLIAFPIYKMIKERKISFIYLYFILMIVFINFEATYLESSAITVFYNFFNFLFYSKRKQLCRLETAFFKKVELKD